MKTPRAVWFGRARAAAWLLAGIAAQVLGLTDSVALVWWASVYANIESGMATAQAADDRGVLREVRALGDQVRGLRDDVARLESILRGE
jgi:hypothetical protein